MKMAGAVREPRLEGRAHQVRQAAAARLRASPAASACKQWIDDCPNMLYSALVFQGGAGLAAAARARTSPIHPDTLDDRAPARRCGARPPDDQPRRPRPARRSSRPSTGAPTDQPVCFIAYTIKGFGLPFQGHKDNHAGLMTKAQMQRAARARGHQPGRGMGQVRRPRACRAAEVEAFLAAVPFDAEGHAAARRRRACPCRPFPMIEAKGADVDAGRLRPHPRRDRARGRAARRPHRHHLARRDRLDQPRAVGEPARPVLDGEPGGRVQGARADVAAALGDEPQGPAHRARHRRDEPVPDAGARSGCRTRCSASGCCRSARSTIPSSAAASMR